MPPRPAAPRRSGRRWPVEPVEPGIAIGMQKAAAGAEQRLGMARPCDPASSDRTPPAAPPSPRAARRARPPTAARSWSCPGRARAPAPWCRRRAARCAGADMPADRLGQGREQEHRLPDPVGQRRAVEFDAFAGIDHGLAVQRQCGRSTSRPATCASRPGPGRPRSIGSDGIGACTIVSQARQLSFGRTCRITLKLEGTYSSTSRSSSPIRLQDGAAAARAGAGRLVDDGLARQMLRQRLADRRPARSRPAGVGELGRRAGSAVLARASLSAASSSSSPISSSSCSMSRSSFSEERPNRARRSTASCDLQLLDVQRLGVDLGVAGGDLELLARQFGLQLCGEDPQSPRDRPADGACQRHGRC